MSHVTHTHSPPSAALDHCKEKGNLESSKLEPETIRAVHTSRQGRTLNKTAQPLPLMPEVTMVIRVS